MAGVTTFVSTGATPPVGFALATDAVTLGGSTGNVEYVKIMDGTAGSTTVAPVSSGSVLGGPGLSVNVVNSTAFPIGVILTGGQSSVTISGTVTTTQSTAAVSSGSALGGPGLQVNVVNSTAFPIGVNLTGGQSSVTVAGAVTVNFSNSNSTTNAVLSTAGMGGSTGTPLVVQWSGWALAAASTFACVSLTSTALTTLLSSGASTVWNITDIAITNQGAAESVATIYDGSTSGTILLQHACASAGGGISRSFQIPRKGTAGNKIAIECVPASTFYIDVSAFRSA